MVTWKVWVCGASSETVYSIGRIKSVFERTARYHLFAKLGICELVFLLDPLRSVFVHRAKRHGVTVGKFHAGRKRGKSFERFAHGCDVGAVCRRLCQRLELAGAFLGQ